jgi:rhomboid family protein
LFILPIEEGNPPRKFPLVNLSLIALNTYIFFMTALNPAFERILWRNGFVPAHPRFHNVLTSMFLHAGLAHLAGNMYFLYVFGNSVENRLGKLNYLAAYLFAGFGACWLQYRVDPHSTLPMIGASGAISGICGLYMLMFPWQKMRLQFFFLIFPIFAIPARAFFVVGFWILSYPFLAPDKKAPA